MSAKKIALLHFGAAYLPELQVYRDYFSTLGHQVSIFTKENLIPLDEYDIEWQFMGTDFTPKTKGRFKIHEYASLSLPPFAKLKNHFKKQLNTRPDLRIFLNERIKQGFNFQDDTPSLIRSAGVGAPFFEKQPVNDPMYDFVYLGAMDKSRRVEQFFAAFLQKFDTQTLLVIGTVSSDLKRTFQSGRIHFTGRVSYAEVPFYLRQSSYGINYMPVTYPYYLQPSYKLLEYCAVGLKVITTNYSWANEFEQQQSGRFFKIAPDWSNFCWETVKVFDYLTPDLHHLTWKKVLDQAGFQYLL